MKTCPWCEGRRVVARLEFLPSPRMQRVMGMTFRVEGSLSDCPCGICEGTGIVSEGRHLELTRNPLDGPAEQWRDV